MSDIQAVTYDDALAVTASNTVADPAGPFAALLVCVTGNLKFTTRAGTTITMTAVPVGTVVPLVTSRVWTTGTTATVVGMLAMPYRGAPVGS